MPAARDLKVRVLFQRRSVDANGDRLGDWEDGFERWGEVAYMALRHGGEIVLQGRLQGTAPASISVRDDSETRDITSAWRARAVSGYPATFNIRSIAPSQRVGWLHMTCEVGDDD